MGNPDLSHQLLPDQRIYLFLKSSIDRAHNDRRFMDLQ